MSRSTAILPRLNFYNVTTQEYLRKLYKLPRTRRDHRRRDGGHLGHPPAPRRRMRPEALENQVILARCVVSQWDEPSNAVSAALAVF